VEYLPPPSAPSAVPVLMYHRICEEASAAMRKFAVPPRQFAAQLRWLSKQGYTGLTVSDFVQRVRGLAEPLPARPVLLTFDDGFADFGEQAAPLLRAHGLPATLYVVAGLVGSTSRWLPGRDAHLPLHDWDALGRLQEAGTEIGAHGMTHRPLDGLPDDELAQEVGVPRERLARELGNAADSFCYPFGFRTARVRQAVRRAGYQSACAVRYGSCHTDQHTDYFDIARHIVPCDLSMADFAAIVEGSPPVVPLVWNRVRSQLGSAARGMRQGLRR